MSEAIENPIPKWDITDQSVQKLLDDILDSGLILVAIKAHGKTEAAKWIAQAFRLTRKDVRVTIFDTCLNWRHRYDSVPYVKMESIIDTIPSVKHLIVDVPFSNAKDTRLAITTPMLKDYDQMCAYKETNYDLPYWNLYIVEEIQNVLGSYALNGREGEFCLKIVSEGRNFHMNYIGIGQRLADISTKVVERAKGYMFGQLTGDNDIKKVAKIAGDKVAEAVKILNKGEFLHYSGCCLHRFTFPIPFQAQGQPYPYDRTVDKSKIMVEDLSWMLRK